MKKLFFTFLLALVVGISAKAETVTVYYDNSQYYEYQYHGTMSDSVTEIYFYLDSQYDYDYDLNQYVYHWYVTAIGTFNESVTIPDSVSYNGTVYPVECFGNSSTINVNDAPNLTEIHLPSTIIYCSGYLPNQILSLYLTSPQVISFYSYFFQNMNSALEIYVPESQYSQYYTGFSNSSYSYLRNAASCLKYERTVYNIYTLNVNTPGTMALKYFEQAAQWGDVDELIVIGSIDSTDMQYFNKMTNLRKLDLRQTDITTIAGCKSLSKLKTVLLPSTVTRVAEYAFSGCSKMDSLLIPDSIIYFGNYAFNNCKKLKSLPLQYLEILGYHALSNCNLPNVLRLPNLKTFLTLSGTADPFSGVQIDSLFMPNINHIPSYCFAAPRAAKYIYVGATSMNNSAFMDNTYIESIDMPKMKYIDRHAFRGCNNLRSVNIPSVEIIYGDAFIGCPITHIELPSIIVIDNSAFENCPIDTLILPASLENIGSNNFYSAPLSHVFCYATFPSQADCFTSSRGGTLHVPTFALNSYRMDDNWSHFANIVPIDSLLENLLIDRDYTLYTTFGLSAKPNIELVAGNLTINTLSSVNLNRFDMYNTCSPQYYQYYNNHYYYYEDYMKIPTILTHDTVTADTISVVMNMKQNEWNFITLPFDVNMSDIVVPDSTYWVIRRYSGQDRANLTGNSWQDMTAGMTLNANEGYIVHCYNYYNSDAISFKFNAANNANKNKIFANGNVALPLNKYASAKAINSNWNLVGNPYPCFLNSSAIQHNGIITVWNGYDYTAYSLLDDQFTLFPGEAFFVQCPNDASSMTFLASGRTKTYNTAVASYAPANFLSIDDNVRKVYNLTLSNDTLSDRTRFVINPSASVEYELSCDASKFAGNSTTAPDFYMIENEEHLAINERPIASGIFSLGFNAKVAGNYTITLESNPDATTRPFITDKQTGEKKCLDNSPYTFYTAAGTFDGRFYISFDEVPAGIDNADSESDFIENGDVYAMDGRFVMHFENRMELDNLSVGTYILRNDVSVEKYVRK